MADRSTRSDNHEVEWATEMKSGWESTAMCAGIVVATPPTSVSDRARSNRRRALSRSGPQATTFATRLS